MAEITVNPVISNLPNIGGPQVIYLCDGVAIAGCLGDPNGVLDGDRGSQLVDVLTGIAYRKTTVFGTLTGWNPEGTISGSTGGTDGAILVANGAGGFSIRPSTWLISTPGQDLTIPEVDTRIEFSGASAFLGIQWQTLLKQILDSTGLALDRDGGIKWSAVLNNPGGATAVLLRSFLTSTGRSNLYADLQVGKTQRLTDLAACTTAAMTITSNAVLAPVPGLLLPVEAGRQYNFQAWLSTTSNAAAGVQIGASGPAMTRYDASGILFNGSALPNNADTTTIGATITGITAVTAGKALIHGSFIPSADGDFQITAAQNVSDVNPTTVKRGAQLNLHPVS